MRTNVAGAAKREQGISDQKVQIQFGSPHIVVGWNLPKSGQSLIKEVKCFARRGARDEDLARCLAITEGLHPVLAIAGVKSEDARFGRRRRFKNIKRAC